MAEYWVDPVAGDNANAGTSVGSPKATLNSAYVAATAGSIIRLASGVYHPGGTSGGVNDVSFVSSSGYIQATGKAGLTITSYDAGYGSDLPVLDGMAWSEPGGADWTHVGSGVWKMVPAGATAVALRLWLGSSYSGIYVGQRQLGNAARRCDDVAPGNPPTPPTYHSTEAGVIAALSESAPWYSTSNNGDFSADPWRIYVWTGSETVDPPTHYGPIAWIQIGVSAANLLVRNEANDVLLENFVVRGVAGTYGLGSNNLSTASLSGLRIKNVTLQAYASVGLSLHGNGVSGYTVSGVELRGVTVDAVTNANEIESGENQFWEVVNDVRLGYCSGVSIDGLTIRPHASNHTALGLGDSGIATATYPGTNLSARNVSIHMQDGCRDGRPFSVRYADGVVFEKSHIYGGNVRCQIAGKNVRISGVQHTELSTAAAQFAGQDVFGAWLLFGPDDYTSENIEISGCTLDIRRLSACGSAFALYRNSTGFGAGANEVTFVNNLAVLNANQTMFGVGVTNNTGPEFDTAREQIYKTNAAQSPDPAYAVKMTAYTGDNKSIHSTFDYPLASSGVAAAPSLVSSAYRPQPGSPLVAVRGLDFTRQGQIAFTYNTWDHTIYGPRVILGADGVYRMYYTAYKVNYANYWRVAMAKSTDLVTWTKPNLARYVAEGDAVNNVVLQSDTNSLQFVDCMIDPATGDHIMTVRNDTTGSNLIYKSPDGDAAFEYISGAVFTGNTGLSNGGVQAHPNVTAESKSLTWSPQHNKWRWWYNHGHSDPSAADSRRSIGYYDASALAGPWTNRGIHPEFTSTATTLQYYDFSPFYYGGALWAVVNMYNRTSEVLSPLRLYRSTNGGDTWTRYADILGRPPAGSWDYGLITDACPILINGTWHLFYGGKTGLHNVSAGAPGQITLGLATAANTLAPVVGTHLGYTRDITGVQRPNPPSVGAHDVATFRKPA